MIYSDFNINEYVLIRVTAKGWEVFDVYYTGLGKNAKEYKEKLYTENGMHKFQLWQVMAIFGSNIGHGKELCFQPEITLLQK